MRLQVVYFFPRKTENSYKPGAVSSPGSGLRAYVHVQHCSFVPISLNELLFSPSPWRGAVHSDRISAVTITCVIPELQARTAHVVLCPYGHEFLQY